MQQACYFITPRVPKMTITMPGVETIYTSRLGTLDPLGLQVIYRGQATA